MSNLVAGGPARSPDCGPVEVSPEPSWGAGSGSAANRGGRALAFVNSVWRRLLRELRQTFRATYEQPVRFLAHAKRRWRRRSVSRAFALAQLALGQRMYAAGIDDGELGAQISVLDEKIRWAEAATASGGALKAERVRLVLQLAAAALADKGPLPGADAEYARACEAEAALQKQDQALLTAQVPLGCSPGKEGWVRATIGYAVMTATVTLALFALSN
jgi:hypothetical protein